MASSSMSMQPAVMGNWPEINEQPIFTLDLQRRNWRYRGEGNANLVLALPDECLILRLHKYDKDKVFTEHERLDEMERSFQEAVFCHSVMVPLIGSAYIQPPALAIIEQAQLQSLQHILVHYQPAHRRHKVIKFGIVAIYPDYTMLPLHTEKFVEDLINMNGLLKSDVTCDLKYESLLNFSQFRTTKEVQLHKIVVGDISTRANLSGNRNDLSLEENVAHCEFPVPGFVNRTYKRTRVDQTRTSIFCVELKPKQGWIPPIDRCKPKCTFCLTQYLKLTEGNIDEISPYCPLDLFSGDMKRMKKALRSLLMQPQNNLKIFKDGDLIYSDNVQNDLLDILKEMFPQSSSIEEVGDFDRIVDEFCDLVLQMLTTDATDSGTGFQVEDFASSDISTGPVINEISDFTESCDWSSQPLPEHCVLNRILRIQQLQQYGIEDIHKMSRNMGPIANDYCYVKSLCNQRGTKKLILNPIQRYLLASTAKDCSILIAFKKISKEDLCCRGHKIIKDYNGQSFIWNVGVSDLDPKPFSCIEKHWKRDINIVTAYTRHFKKI